MPIVVVIRLHAADSDVVVSARELLAALQLRPGFLRGSVSQSVEDDGGLALVARFADLGSWRRALGAADVKLVATPLLGAAAESVGTYEVLDDLGPGPDPISLRR
jgi:hypothetical protein